MPNPPLRLFSLGVRPDTPPRVAQRITAANGSILANGVGATLAGLALVLAGQREVGLTLFLVPSVLLIGLVFMVLRRPTLGRLWCVASQAGVMLLVGSAVGAGVVYAVPFAIVLVPFTVFSTDERGLLVGSLLLTIAATAVLFAPELLPGPWIAISDDVAPVVEAIVGLAVFVSICVSLYVAARARDVGLEQLDDARAEAQRAQRAQASFLANMSHEIRTPLSAILGWVQLLDDPRASQQERQRAVDTLRRNSSHLMELVDQVLDLSKMEAGELLVESVPTSIVGIIEDVASLMRVRASACEIDFVVSWEGPIPDRVSTDPLRLRQVLLNLVGNAVKFTEQGRVEIRTRLSGRELHIAVEDTGIGMEAESVDRLFGSFIQADASTARRFGGTGLGLSISRELTRRLGARLRVTSQPGEGSCFVLVLPVAPEEAAVRIDPTAAPRPRDPDQLDEGRLGGLRVLLAEDSDDLAELVRVQLRYRGAEVERVGNGQAALDLLAADPSAFHVVLMDMQMPVLDGYRAVRFIRARGWKIPVIALTAHAMAGDRERCLAAGCDGYLTKPIDFGALTDRLRPLATTGRPDEDGGDPGVDSARLTETLALLKAQFTAAVPGRVATIRAALEAGRLDEVRHGAHKLAGSSGSLGLTTIGERARELELAIDGHAARRALHVALDRLEQAAHVDGSAGDNEQTTGR